MEVHAIGLPTTGGQLLITAGRPPLSLALTIGVLTILTSARTRLAAVHGGQAMIDPGTVEIRADAIEFTDAIDLLRARHARTRATARLLLDAGDHAAGSALRRANLRLALAAHHTRRPSQ